MGGGWWRSLANGVLDAISSCKDALQEFAGRSAFIGLLVIIICLGVPAALTAIIASYGNVGWSFTLLVAGILIFPSSLAVAASLGSAAAGIKIIVGGVGLTLSLTSLLAASIISRGAPPVTRDSLATFLHHCTSLLPAPITIVQCGASLYFLATLVYTVKCYRGFALEFRLDSGAFKDDPSCPAPSSLRMTTSNDNAEAILRAADRVAGAIVDIWGRRG